MSTRVLGVWVLSVLWSCSNPPPKPQKAPPPPPRADLALFRATVITQNDEPATALAMMDGRIVAVGDLREVLDWVGTETRVLDLKGYTVIPGLVDAHLHLAGIGESRIALDLVGTTSLEEIKQAVANVAAKTPPGEWIRGRGWDQNDWRARRFPSARDLDQVSPDHPVVLTRIDGRALWANSLAMEAAQITTKTPEPEGGRILKKRGRPSGIFIEEAMSLVQNYVPPLSPQALQAALTKAQEECLAAGLTQVHDMGLTPEALNTLEQMDTSGALKLRVYGALYGSVDDFGSLLAQEPRIPDPFGPERLTVRSVEIYMDGALNSRDAALLKPYRDDRRNRGRLIIDPLLFKARVQTAYQRGYQVATHAVGDRANRIVLDTYEQVFGEGLEAARPRIEHAQVLHPRDIPRFAATGVIASMQPMHAISDMPWAPKRLGRRRLGGAYAWQTLLTSGATIAAGSDAPVQNVSPLLGLYAAITRKDQLGFPAKGWRPKERMTARQALESFTMGGAWASFRQNVAGRIETGRIADLTVLAKNPLTATEDDLATNQVMMTIIGGQIEWAQPGAETPIDLETLTATTTATITSG